MNKQRKSVLKVQHAATLAIILALFVVMLGAYTRLTDAGLGCPDWPGCYGRLVLPSNQNAIKAMQQNFPALETGKAWTEMAHRYAAGALVLLIIFIALTVFRLNKKGQDLPWKIPVLLLFLLVFQACLGMWTVTMKLLPIVVMSHLLGGMLIFTLLCVLRVQFEKVKPINLPSWRFWIKLGLLLVFIQIALGGWVSSNYAGIACVGFPTCNGQWLPPLHFSEGFNLFTPVGANYQGGLLESEARITIQFIHRMGAVFTALFIGGLSLLLLIKVTYTKIRVMAFLVLLLLGVQWILGIINVVYLLPLWVSVAHNGVAALLLASVSLLLSLGASHE